MKVIPSEDSIESQMRGVFCKPTWSIFFSAVSSSLFSLPFVCVCVCVCVLFFTSKSFLSVSLLVSKQQHKDIEYLDTNNTWGDNTRRDLFLSLSYPVFVPPPP